MPPFVIQHSVHPAKFKELKTESMQKFAEKQPDLIAQIKVLRDAKIYQDLSLVLRLAQFNDARLNAYVNNVLDNLSLDVEDIVKAVGIRRDCCPKCNKLVTMRHFRKTWKKYKCEDGHLFEIPDETIWYKKYRTKDKVVAIRSAKLELLRMEKSLIDKKIYELSKDMNRQVGKEAFLKAFEEHTIYMSMKHTKTFCKSCAHKEDYNNGLIN